MTLKNRNRYRRLLPALILASIASVVVAAFWVAAQYLGPNTALLTALEHNNMEDRGVGRARSVATKENRRGAEQPRGEPSRRHGSHRGPPTMSHWLHARNVLRATC